MKFHNYKFHVLLRSSGEYGCFTISLVENILNVQHTVIIIKSLYIYRYEIILFAKSINKCDVNRSLYN